VVLKFNNCNFAHERAQAHELNMLQHIKAANPSHKGYSFLRTVLDSFTITGPHGNHICLVCEPMRESLLLFRHHFLNKRLPLPLVKAYIRIILTGLDYLHSQCHVVHTS